jgi:NADH-quinone oxidoreductase subunit E
VSRLSAANEKRARDLIALYPEPRSALIPILHVAQEQDGWLTPDAMTHVAEMLDLSAAEVLGTASFYDMLFTHPVGRHLVSVCTNIACLLNGGYELLEHAEERLGVTAGGTTVDGEFTLEEVECIALCGNAPCLTVNWRFFGDVTNDSFDKLVGDIKAGRMADEIPPHGTLNRVRRSVGLVTAGAPAAAPRIEVTATDTAPGGQAPSKPSDVAAAGYPEAKPESQAHSEAAAADAVTVEQHPDQGRPGAPS